MLSAEAAGNGPSPGVEEHLNQAQRGAGPRPSRKVEEGRGEMEQGADRAQRRGHRGIDYKRPGLSGEREAPFHIKKENKQTSGRVTWHRW